MRKEKGEGKGEMGREKAKRGEIKEKKVIEK